MDEMKEEPEENAIFRPNMEMQLHTEHSAICGSEEEDQDSRDSTSYGPHAGFWLQTGLLDPRPPEPGSSSLLLAPPPVPSGPAPFCCALCGAVLPCREALTDHLTTHAVGRPPLCALCGTQLHNSGDVRRHMMTHSGEKPFVCDRCQKRFTRRHALHNHQMNCRHGNAGPAPPQQEEAFCCCVCTLSFTTRPALTAHMVVHVGGDPPRCQVCTRKVSPHISNILRHMMLHSGEKKEASKKRSTPRPTKVCVDAAPLEEETFTCSVCAHRSDSASLLTDHMTNHVIISEACGTCLVCHKTIQKSKNDVRRHMMIHSGEKPYVCVGCGKSFNRNSTLQVHMNICSVAVPVHKESPEKSAEEEDDEEGTFGCCLCEKQFFRKGLLTDHLTTHLSDPPGTCLICGKGVGTKRNDVRRHMMIHSGEKPFSCSQCGMRFNRKFTLRHHNKLCTQGAPQEALQCDESPCPDDGALEQGLQVKGEEPEDEINTRCKFCNESFYEPSQLTEHMAVHTDDITGACLICGKALGRTVAQVRQHMMVHSGEKPFSCSVCGRRFIRTLALKHHMKTHEAGAQQETSKPAHACPVCAQTFKTLTVLKYHMFIHSGVRPFACSVCGKRFRQRGDVRRHMMLHSGERPFSCRACGRSFNRRNALRLHLRTHIAGGVVDEALLDVPAEGADAPDRGLSPVIVCDGCGQGFSRSLHFNRHLSACGKLHRRSDHAPFSCSLCAESFAEREGLVEHVLTHKDGEYVSCAICNKSLRRGDLKAHLSLHAGEKRHICPSCGKGFSRNTHLRGHMRTHDKHQSLLPGAKLSAQPTAAPTDQPGQASSPAASPPATSFPCQICGKAYGKKSSLVSHVAENHKQPSSFKCPVCSKFLRRKSDLKRHLLTHSDNKPFTCRLCGKGFGRSDQLRGHVSAHHREDELTAGGGASEEGSAGEPQSHSCPDCMFPCPTLASYNCPSTGLLLVDCPSCERSFSL